MILRFSMALALAGTALPAHAADLATLDCVAGKFDSAASEQLGKDVERTLGEAGKVSYDPATLKGLQTAASACAKEHGWNAAAAKAASAYALAKLGWPVAQRVLSEKGFDPAMLETQFLMLPEEQRNRPLTTPELQQLVRDSVTDEAQQTRENADLVGKFFLFANTMQYASYDFAQA